jgi:hypothetical protein
MYIHMQRRRAPAAAAPRRVRAAAPALLARSGAPALPDPPRHPRAPPRRTPAAADARWSAACFAASCAAFLPWLLAFSVGGPAVVGQGVFDAMDATQIDIWSI